MIRRICLCYLFLAAVLLIQAEMAQRDETTLIELSQE